MRRRGNSMGKGAGWLYRLLVRGFESRDSVSKRQMLRVQSTNSWLAMPLVDPEVYSSFIASFEKTRMYSCTSRRVGLDARAKLPHAVDTPADAPLSQMISPRMRKPRRWNCRTIYA